MKMKYKFFFSMVLLFSCVLCVFILPSRYKHERTIYTDQMLHNARNNYKSVEWRNNEDEEYIKKADKYLELFDYLFESISSQDVPRSYVVSIDQKQIHNRCLYCKMDLTSKYGNYPWKIDQKNSPWKLECPNCSTIFPTNDYESYYKSGLDSNLIFNKELANKDFLKNNSNNPNIKKMGEMWGVDDGTGFFFEDVNYTFIAYYNHWGNWLNGKTTTSLIQGSLDCFNKSYIRTGNKKYAEAGIILLYKISLIYPELDTSLFLEKNGFYNNSSYGGGKGISVGNIWECSLMDVYADSYDLFFSYANSAYVLSYLKSDTKINGNLVKESIEKKIFESALKNVKSLRIYGNFPFHQSALIKIAILLQNTYSQEILDFVFKDGEVKNNDGVHTLTGGNIENMLYSLIDVDGLGNEVAPEYNSYTVSGLIEIANLLKKNDYNAFLESGKLKLVITNFEKMILENNQEIQLGDSGYTGFGKFHLEIADYISIYESTQDVDYLRIIERLVKALNIDDNEIHYSVFHKDPSSLKDKISTSKLNVSQYNFNLSTYGLSSISNGKDQIYMYYGNGQKHGHRDLLNFGIIDANNDLSPDLGYPTYTDENGRRIAWESNSLSHNTVIVNGMNQNNSSLKMGDLESYNNNDKVKFMSVDAPFLYENIDKYKRSLISINLSENNKMDYLIDFFEIDSSKSNEYLYSFHGFNDKVISNKCINIEKISDYDNFDLQNSWDYKGSGFNYLDNYRKTSINRSKGGIVWQDYEENKFLAMIPLNHQSVYLAEGPKPLHPENNERGDKLTYAFLKEISKKAKFHNIYVTSKEMYESIREIKIVKSDNNSSIYRIEFMNNRIDYLIFSDNKSTIETTVFNSKCDFGLISFIDNKLNYSYVNNGEITVKETVVQSSCFMGKVIDFEEGDLYQPEVTIELEEGEEKLNNYIYFCNENDSNKGVEIFKLNHIKNNIYKFKISNKSLILMKENNDFIYWIYKNQSVYFKVPGVLDNIA